MSDTGVETRRESVTEARYLNQLNARLANAFVLTTPPVWLPGQSNMSGAPHLVDYSPATTGLSSALHSAILICIES